MKRIAFALALTVSAVVPVMAQQTPPKFGCEDVPATRQLDFWVGEWEVRVTGTTNVAGSSSIQSINGGCTILENWTGGRGGVGKSFNFYNPATRRWHQTWVDNAGGMTFFTGEYRDRAMRFDAGEHVNRNGTLSTVRLTFFHVAADTVRQLGENLAADGKTWQVGYDLTYVRK
jgi:hypothetical protein